MHLSQCLRFDWFGRERRGRTSEKYFARLATLAINRASVMICLERRKISIAFTEAVFHVQH